MKEKVISYVKTHRPESIISGVVIVALIGAGGFLLVPKMKFTFHFPFPQGKKVAKTEVTTISPDDLIRQKNAAIIASAAKQIALPTNEQPILATVSDRDKLQNQDFFKQAQNGDKILLFPKNKKAFLYRPSLDQVLAQAPLIYQDTPPDASVAAVATQAAHQFTGPVPTIKPNGKVLYNNQ